MFHISHIDMDTWISIYYIHINISYNWIPKKTTIPPFSQSCIILRTTHFSGQVKHNFNPLGNLTSSQRFCCLSSSEGSSITASVMVSCKAWINLNPRESKWIRPQQSPTILTYRHLISGHILLIKEVNTLHFLTSDGVTRLVVRKVTGPQVSWGSLPKATGTKVSCSKQTDLKEPCVRCARLCRALAIGATKRQWGYHSSAVFHIIPNILWSTSS